MPDGNDSIGTLDAKGLEDPCRMYCEILRLSLVKME